MAYKRAKVLAVNIENDGQPKKERSKRHDFESIKERVIHRPSHDIFASHLQNWSYISLQV